MTNPMSTEQPEQNGSTKRLPAWLTPRLIVSLLLLALALIFIASNQSVTRVHVLFWTAFIPLWALLLIVLVLGIAIGAFLPWLRRHKNRSS